jgi:hypothetical protein
VKLLESSNNLAKVILFGLEEKFGCDIAPMGISSFFLYISICRAFLNSL